MLLDLRQAEDAAWTTPAYVHFLDAWHMFEKHLADVKLEERECDAMPAMCVCNTRLMF